MPEPETVIAEVQAEAVAEAATPAIVATEMVAAEVAAVDEHLAEHAELSEERHEEILGGNEWLQNQMAGLSTLIQANQSTLSAFQAQVTSQFQELRTMIEQTPPNQTPLTDTNPTTPPETVPEVPVVVEPVDAEPVRMPESPEAPARQKRRRVI